VDHPLPLGVEGVPDVEANGQSIVASVTRVHEMPVKRVQRVIGTTILSPTELPSGQSNPGITHEILHPIQQQCLQYPPDVVQEI